MWLWPNHAPGGGRISRPNFSPPLFHADVLRLLRVFADGQRRADFLQDVSSDPKKFRHDRGPPRDVIRIYNFARCVRDEAK